MRGVYQKPNLGIFTVVSQWHILPLCRLFHASSQPPPQIDPHSRTREGWTQWWTPERHTQKYKPFLFFFWVSSFSWPQQLHNNVTMYIWVILLDFKVQQLQMYCIEIYKYIILRCILNLFICYQNYILKKQQHSASIQPHVYVMILHTWLKPNAGKLTIVIKQTLKQ